MRGEASGLMAFLYERMYKSYCLVRMQTKAERKHHPIAKLKAKLRERKHCPVKRIVRLATCIGCAHVR